MIITRSPLRITLGGGGTDQASYYSDYGGFVIAAAIDKYVYTSVNNSFRNKITLKYSKIEDVNVPEEVEHPVIREALKLLKIPGCVDIDVISDIPAGTGLGSSGSFTTALLQALHLFKREAVTKQDLAEEAYHVEHDLLKQPVGKQDQYIAAVGGVTRLSFWNSGMVTHEPLQMEPEILANLEDGLLLFFTGYTRSASSVLSDQVVKSEQGNLSMIKNLHAIKEIGVRSKDALQSGNLRDFANLMNEQWTLKQSRSSGMSNDRIDGLYKLALDNGALGGKLVGAGGGGFLLFYTEEKVRLRRAMLNAGLREVRFKFDFEGTSTMVHA